MIPLVVLCNKCGECCKQGGACSLREESWSGKIIPLEFTGVCDLLLPNGECSVMKRVIDYHGSDELLRTYQNVVGICNFPELRK